MRDNPKAIIPPKPKAESIVPAARPPEPFTRTIFLTATDYHATSATFDALMGNYKGVQGYPEDGPLRESMAGASIAKSASNRAAFLRELAKFATIAADRLDRINRIGT